MTKFSLALIRAGRAIFGTVKWISEDEAAFVMLDSGMILPIEVDDVFTSRGNVTNAAVRKGSALLTGSSMALTTLTLRPNAFYTGIEDAIRYATVGDDVPEAEKDRIIAGLHKGYGWSK